jgi:hypothetical protein
MKPNKAQNTTTLGTFAAFLVTLVGIARLLLEVPGEIDQFARLAPLKVPVLGRIIYAIGISEVYAVAQLLKFAMEAFGQALESAGVVFVVLIAVVGLLIIAWLCNLFWPKLFRFWGILDYGSDPGEPIPSFRLRISRTLDDALEILAYLMMMIVSFSVLQLFWQIRSNPGALAEQDELRKNLALVVNRNNLDLIAQTCGVFTLATLLSGFLAVLRPRIASKPPTSE